MSKRRRKARKANSAMADALVEELLRGGTRDSDGEFTLSPGEARQKRLQHQQAHPETWILDVVAAAVRQGATAVAVQVGRRHVAVRFDGQGLTPADLERRYDLGGATTDGAGVQAAQHLGRALLALSACHLRRLRLTTHAQDGASLLTLLGGEGGSEGGAPEEHIETVRAPALPPGQTTLRARFGPRPRPGGALPEATLVRQRCRYASVPVLLNGARVSHGLRLGDEVVAVEEIRDPGLTGCLGWEWQEQAAPRQAGELRLVRGGVWQASQPLPGAGPDFVAVVDAPALKLDLSGRAVVRDAALDDVLARVEHARVALQERHDVPRLLDASARPRIAAEVDRICAWPLRRVHGALWLGLLLALITLAATLAPWPAVAVGVTAVVAALCGGGLYWMIPQLVSDALAVRFPPGSRARAMALEALTRRRQGRSPRVTRWLQSWAETEPDAPAAAPRAEEPRPPTPFDLIPIAYLTLAGLEILTTLLRLYDTSDPRGRVAARLARQGQASLTDLFWGVAWTRTMIVMPGMAVVLAALSGAILLRWIQGDRALRLWGLLALLVTAAATLVMIGTAGFLEPDDLGANLGYAAFPLFVVFFASLSPPRPDAAPG